MADLFLPSAEGGDASRLAIAMRLHESLEHVLERCAEHVPVGAEQRDGLLQHLASGRRVPPAVFGGLFDLVQAVEEGTLDDVARSVERLLGLEVGDAVPLRIRPLSRRFFTVEEEMAFRLQFTSESLIDEQIVVLDDDKADKAAAAIRRGLTLLERHAPASFGEVAAVVSEIVPVGGKPHAGMVFDGCSSLERWGAILFNATLEKSDLVIAESIVHEAAHTSLFGKAPVTFLVENGDDERFVSPLRVDPRPMNGIYHATFVLARMHFAMHEIATSTNAPAALRGEACALLRRSAELFDGGYRIVVEHARLTPEGQAIIDATARWMTVGAKVT